jgi:2-dehydro-3-deoxyglucarate aldolase/4-hydroxy-2-oxoheptanedioate aldolase
MIAKTNNRFANKLRQKLPCLGTCITFNDPTVTEALCSIFDFVWIDMEHNALTLETVQAHIMATKGSETIPLVRVPWNDPVLIKPILDIGAAGVIVPLIRTADDAKRAVAACLYPPDGIRGFGPRRPSNYGQLFGPDFCHAANDGVTIIVQIEHIEAVNNIDAIVAIRGLTSILVGPNDLSGSMGHMGEPRHPEVLQAIDKVIASARRKDFPVGIAFGDDPEDQIQWLDKGVNWLALGADFSLLLKASTEIARQLRQHGDRRLQ